MTVDWRRHSALSKARPAADRAARRCARCAETKPLDAFGIDRRHGTPRSWCKRCQAAATRAWKAANRTELLARGRAQRAARSSGA